eukprot:859470-Amphidinium_carterae.1
MDRTCANELCKAVAMSDPVAPLSGGVLKPRAFVYALEAHNQTCHAFGVCVCLREAKPDSMGVGSSKGSACCLSRVTT